MMFCDKQLGIRSSEFRANEIIENLIATLLIDPNVVKTKLDTHFEVKNIHTSALIPQQTKWHLGDHEKIEKLLNFVFTLPARKFWQLIFSWSKEKKRCSLAEGRCSFRIFRN